MGNRLKIRVTSYENFLYFILIPLLHPQGFQVYFPVYKIFFTVWMYLAMILIICMFCFIIAKHKIVLKKCVWFMLLYYLTFIAITLIVQGGVSEGLQKLFMAPALCLLCAMCLQKNSEKFICCISNILIINLGLNITLFNPLLWKQYFNIDGHIIFLGHVQVVAQLGILGIFISYILYELNKKKKSKWLLILSLITLAISDTSASYIVLILVFIFYLMSKRLKLVKKAFFKPGALICIFILVNLLLWFFVKNFTSGSVYKFMAGITNGRTFVWRKALELVDEHWLIGYGAYGVLIQVFWHQWSDNPSGMNYAHNEVLQRLLDGGIILLLLFLLMIYMYIKNIKKISNNRLNYWANAVLTILLVIMLAESVTEYYYFFILISILAYLPEIEIILERRKLNDRINIKNQI